MFSLFLLPVSRHPRHFAEVMKLEYFKEWFNAMELELYVCMYVCMVITYSRVWINRVMLPILLVVS